MEVRILSCLWTYVIQKAQVVIIIHDAYHLVIPSDCFRLFTVHSLKFLVKSRISKPPYMAVLSITDLYLADQFLNLIQKIENPKSDPDKFAFFGEKLAKVASKSAKFAKVVSISAKGQSLFEYFVNSMIPTDEKEKY